MAIPTYATDLIVLDDFEGSTTDSEFTGYIGTAKPNDSDTDFPIQGSAHISSEQRNTGTGSIAVDNGSNITWTSGWNVFMWGTFLAPAAVNTFASGGIVMMIGSATSSFYKWTVGGNDFGRYPYGGWTNFVCDPEVSAGRTTTGSPGTNYRWAGMGCSVISAISKGSPYGVDVIRYGRGEISAINGDAATYGNFDDMATKNDANDGTSGYNRWGLFSYQGGAYLWKGLMTLGNATEVDFRDTNRYIVIDNTINVASGFNRIEINNASSNVEWINISISSLGTVSKGEFEMIDNATVDFSSCVFTDMSTFIFDSNATIYNTTFRRCELVTQNGSDFDGCTFDEANGANALLVDTPTQITNSTFNSDGTGYAMEIGGTAADYTLTGLYFNNYATTNGTTGNEAIFVNISSGTMTLTISGGNTPTIRTAGATVTVSNNNVLTISGLITGSDISITEASTDTELINVDANVGTTYDYTYNGADAGDSIDVAVYKAGYVPYYIRGLILSSNPTSSAQVAQVADRNYE